MCLPHHQLILRWNAITHVPTSLTLASVAKFALLPPLLIHSCRCTCHSWLSFTQTPLSCSKASSEALILFNLMVDVLILWWMWWWWGREWWWCRLSHLFLSISLHFSLRYGFVVFLVLFGFSLRSGFVVFLVLFDFSNFRL